MYFQVLSANKINAKKENLESYILYNHENG